MKRTGPGVLIVAAILGGGAGYLFDQMRAAAGAPTFTPVPSLPMLLIAVGVVIVALAVPIHRAATGRTAGPVNPFRAVRVAMLAKASSLVGAVFGGAGLGLLAFVVSRPAEPSVGSVSALVATVVCAALLVVAGLIAEHLCTIRKDDDDKHPGPGTGPDDTTGPDRPRVEGPGGSRLTH